MNNDLISRDAVLTELEEELEYERKYSGAITATTAFKIAIRRVKKARAVDAEPVRRGRWIENEDTDVYAGFWNCSECGHEIYSDLALIEELQEQGYALYCEHCGAKMRGVE